MRKVILLNLVVLLVMSASASGETLLVPSEYPTIQTAIEAAVNGDTVVVADGTYTGTGNRDIDFLGKAITVRSENEPESCIIDCENSGRGFCFQSGEDENSILSGVMIINGQADNGGGIYCANSGPTINNCTISDSSAQTFGGGICYFWGDVIITNCTISGNNASYGGGIFCYEDTSTISNCIISTNTATTTGGGLGCAGSRVTINNCTISGNSANNSNGGGIYGGLSSRSSNIIVNTCIINSNSAADGGGICSFDGNCTINNCTIVDNSAVSGGGINCIRNNESTIENCILWGNSAQWGNEIALSDCQSGGLPEITISYSDVQGGAEEIYLESGCAGRINWGVGNIDTDPCFVDVINGDYHLLSTSLCIQAGDPCYIAVQGATDIDGEPRIMNHYVEIGADEHFFTTAFIIISSAEFDFSAMLGGANPNDQILSVSNGSSEVLDWVISYDCNWLDVSPTYGSSTGEENEVVLSVDITGLTWGKYNCNLTITDSNALNSPQTVAVELRVFTVYVPSDFGTIQDAVDNALDGDLVIVADGIYDGPGNRDIDFGGKVITVRSENGPSNCIIDCNGTATEPHRGFYFHSSEGPDSVLGGFTITNGYEEYGAGIRCYYSNPTISGCVFTKNTAVDDAGGIYNSISSPTVTNCVFTSNMAYDKGGGMYNTESNPTVTNCTFSSNSTNEDGSGMYNDRSSPTITNCSFIGNMAGDRGGGMSNGESSPTVTNCSFIGNTAGGWGGGIDNDKEISSTIIDNCIFIDNAGAKGGAMSNDSGGRDQVTEPTIINCMFIGNTASSGGAIYNKSGTSNSMSTPVMINCFFVGNTASKGGAVHNHSGTGDAITAPLMTSCLFTGNKAVDEGGGIYNSSGTGRALTSPILVNSTLAGNSAPTGGGIYSKQGISSSETEVTVTNCILWNGGNEIWNDDGATISITYSDIQDGWSGVGNIDVDPCFVELGYWDANGTPSDVNDDFWVDGDYHLLPDSACIDTGDPCYAADVNETDLDGNPRVIGGRIDMGAYEANYIEVAMKFTPQTLNPGSGGNWVKAHFVLPEGFVIEDVDVNTPAVIATLGIESEYINVFINEDGLVEVEAAFSRSDFCGLLISDETIEVTAMGLLTTGQYFYGTDTIRIISKKLEQLAVLSSYWLQEGCGQPDWCSGADLNQDSIVNFVDFAMLDGCCIEVVRD